MNHKFAERMNQMGGQGQGPPAQEWQTEVFRSSLVRWVLECNSPWCGGCKSILAHVMSHHLGVQKCYGPCHDVTPWCTECNGICHDPSPWCTGGLMACVMTFHPRLKECYGPCHDLSPRCTGVLWPITRVYRSVMDCVITHHLGVSPRCTGVLWSVMDCVMTYHSSVQVCRRGY